VVEERRVASAVGEKELNEALAGPGAGILRGILEGN
jgi:cell division control protein 6